MKLSEAIARDLPFVLRIPLPRDGDPDHAVEGPLDWLWELKAGGIAYVHAGAAGSPGIETHIHYGTVSGEGRGPSPTATASRRTARRWW
jgi:hypothetical protein